MKANPNEPKSTCLQAVLELKLVGAPITEELLNFLRCHENLLRKADNALQAKQYPDNKITFIQTQKDGLKAASALSIDAQAILLIVLAHVGVSLRFCFRLSHIKQYLADQSPDGKCGKTRATCALRELIDTGMIFVRREGAGRTPAIYQLNPKIASFGSVPKSWYDDTRCITLTGANWGHLNVRMPDNKTHVDILPANMIPKEEKEKEHPTADRMPELEIDQ
jgi:hypothetical protein